MSPGRLRETSVSQYKHIIVCYSGDVTQVSFQHDPFLVELSDSSDPLENHSPWGRQPVLLAVPGLGRQKRVKLKASKVPFYNKNSR